MKSKKILTVVLTFAITLSMSLDFIAAKKASNNFAKNSSFMIKEEKNNIDNIKKVSSTKLAKDKRNIKVSSTVTSRGGMRKPLEDATITNEAETKPVEAANAVENAPAEQPVEEVVPAKPSFEGVELQYSAPYKISSARLSKSKGVTYYNGHKETYYSQKVLSGKGLKKLNSNGRHVASDGTVRDGDGYIAVACNYLPKGSRIMTSLGPGKVYDTGGMTGKWIDIYVNW